MLKKKIKCGTSRKENATVKIGERRDAHPSSYQSLPPTMMRRVRCDRVRHRGDGWSPAVVRRGRWLSASDMPAEAMGSRVVGRRAASLLSRNLPTCAPPFTPSLMILEQCLSRFSRRARSFAVRLFMPERAILSSNGSTILLRRVPHLRLRAEAMAGRETSVGDESASER
jgi:hypothetical protein